LEKLGLKISSKLQVSLLRLVQNQRIKSTIAENLESWVSKSDFQIRVQN
jgi:hypothetical protein